MVFSESSNLKIFNSNKVDKNVSVIQYRRIANSGVVNSFHLYRLCNNYLLRFSRRLLFLNIHSGVACLGSRDIFLEFIIYLHL